MTSTEDLIKQIFELALKARFIKSDYTAVLTIASEPMSPDEEDTSKRGIDVALKYNDTQMFYQNSSSLNECLLKIREQLMDRVKRQITYQEKEKAELLKIIKSFE